VYAYLFNTSWDCGVVFVCQPCSRCSGPVDRSVGYRTTGLCVWDAAAEAGAWAPYCVLGAAVERRRCVGIVRGPAAVALLRVGWLISYHILFQQHREQCAHLGAFRVVFWFLYFRCSLDVFYLLAVCVCVLPCIA